MFWSNPQYSSCHIPYQYWHFTADWINGARAIFSEGRQEQEPGKGNTNRHWTILSNLIWAQERDTEGRKFAVVHTSNYNLYLSHNEEICGLLSLDWDVIMLRITSLICVVYQTGTDQTIANQIITRKILINSNFYFFSKYMSDYKNLKIDWKCKYSLGQTRWLSRARIKLYKRARLSWFGLNSKLILQNN